MLNLEDKVLQELKEKNGENTFNFWLSSLKFKIKDENLTVLANSEYFCRKIKDDFSDQITKIFKKNGKPVNNINFKVLEKKEENSEKAEDTIKTEEKKKKKKPLKADNSYLEIKPNTNLKLSPKFTFDSFIIGNNNEMASAAAKAVISNPGTSYNPLFIYGKTGLGKTHLMQAIGHSIYNDDKTKKVVYITCEDFMNMMLEALEKRSSLTNKYQSMSNFKRKFRKADVLMVDDIQFLVGKTQTQEEFFNTFNSLYQEHKQIVLTSDRPPQELKGLQERLVSRFEWGLVTDVQSPGFETRLLILRKKCELSGWKVNEETLEFLAEHFVDNVRQMEGALNRVYHYAKLVNKPVTINFAKEILKDLIKADKIKKISVEDILKKVADLYNVTILQLQGPKRLKNIAYPRQIAMYLSRSMTDLSLPEIGKAFGGRDHTTVLHACKKIEKQLEEDISLRQSFAKITESIVS